MMEFNIPDNILRVMDIMKENGYESYLVGGCVRDFLMGKIPHDFDITTNAKPEETIACFSDFKVIETGLKHGTVTVIIDKEPIEITTFRIDGKYTDNRHPENVMFTSDLREDLSRRDFTVNALAYNRDVGIVDMFSGQEDLGNKIIRTVGNPDMRFLEDGLRILRALRFASVLDFKICDETADSIKRNKELLLNISKERIYSEMSKLICGVNASEILMEFRDVIEVFLPDLKECKNYDKSIFALSDLPERKELRYAALFSECDSPKEELMSLKSDKKTAEYANMMSNYLNFELVFDEIFLKKLLINLEYDELYDIIILKEAFCEELTDIKSLVESIEKSGECVKIKDLKIDGKDIMEKGVASGKAVGDILKKLLIMVIEEKIQNNREELLDYISNLKSAN